MTIDLRKHALMTAIEAKRAGEGAPFMELVDGIWRFLSDGQAELKSDYNSIETPAEAVFQNDAGWTKPDEEPAPDIVPDGDKPSDAVLEAVKAILERGDRPNLALIGFRTGLSQTAIRSALQCLSDLGLLKIEGHGRARRYSIPGQPPPEETEPEKKAGRWDGEDGDRLRELWADATLTNGDIGKRLGISAGRVSQLAGEMGLPPRRKGPATPKPTSPQRRFNDKPDSDPKQVKGLADDHPAVTEGRTLFPTTVVAPFDSPRLLVSGHNSRKLGKQVVKGPWKGMPIYQLTLEERATCDRSCEFWKICYGNAMHMARRHKHGPALEKGLHSELGLLQRQYPKGFVVRLHVLGDFYSVEYVQLWRKWLQEFPALRVFGYTGRPRDSEIGKAIKSLTDKHWYRFAIRFSEAGSKPQGATVIFRKPESAVVPEGLVCPYDSGATECCATCGLCWAESARDKTIVFVAHGNTNAGRPRKPAPAEPDVLTRLSSQPKPANATDRAVAEAVAQGRVRRFEASASTDPFVVGLYLEEHGHKFERLAGSDKFRVDGKPMRFRGVLEIADKHRKAEGLPPLQRGAA